MDAVPGLLASLRVFPLMERFPPSVARTCTPLILNVSNLFAELAVVKVNVSVDAVNDNEALVISRFELIVTVGAGEAAELNSHPVGGVRMSVTPVCFAAKSVFAVSAILIDPRVVQPGLDAFAALSAEMFVPPVAGVTVTWEKADPAQDIRSPASNAKRNMFRDRNIIALGPPSLYRDVSASLDQAPRYMLVFFSHGSHSSSVHGRIGMPSLLVHQDGNERVLH